MKGLSEVIWKVGMLGCWLVFWKVERLVDFVVVYLVVVKVCLKAVV